MNGFDSAWFEGGTKEQPNCESSVALNLCYLTHVTKRQLDTITPTHMPAEPCSDAATFARSSAPPACEDHLHFPRQRLNFFAQNNPLRFTNKPTHRSEQRMRSE